MNRYEVSFPTDHGRTRQVLETHLDINAVLRKLSHGRAVRYTIAPDKATYRLIVTTLESSIVIRDLSKDPQ